MEVAKTLEIHAPVLRPSRHGGVFCRSWIFSCVGFALCGLWNANVSWCQEKRDSDSIPPSESTSSSGSASVLIRNGRVLRPDGSFAEALAIRDHRIVWIGSNLDAKRWEKEAAVVLDARNGTVTPGLNDAHVHFISGSLSLTQIALGDLNAEEQVLERIRDYVNRHPNTAVIQGRGWLYGAFKSGLPHRQLLDAIVPDRPAVMRSYDGHTAWVNTVALHQAGITRDTADPVRGVIVRDENGDATGVLKESAQRLLDSILPKPTFEEKCEAVLVGAREAHRLGITSIQEAGSDEEDVRVFASLQSNNQLKLRLSIALSGRSGMTDQEWTEMRALRTAHPDLHIHGVKLFVDGVIESHTAVLLSPYANNPTLGLAAFTQSELERVVQLLDKDLWNIQIHAIGDGGVRMSLDAFEKAIQQNRDRPTSRRHRLEHVETIQLADIPRFKQLGVIASMQPMHASPNSNVFQIWAANLGPERASRAWPWNSIRSAGGRLAFGTDWPVVDIAPAFGLHVAVTRQTPEGLPKNGFYPEQCVPLREAIEAYSLGSAIAEEREADKGTLEVGKLADIAVWNQDLFRTNPSELYRAKVRYTLVNGTIVYSAPDGTD